MMLIAALLFFAAVADTTPWCNTYEVGSLTVPMPTATSLRLVVIGDAGDAWAASQCGKPVCSPPSFTPTQLATAVKTATADRAADAILVLGDNIYPCGVNDRTVGDAMTIVYQQLFNLNVPMYAVLGNHDYSDGGGRCGPAEHAAVMPQDEVTYIGGTWHMPARNYVLHWPGLASIVMVDSEPVRNGCGSKTDIINFVKTSVAAIPAGEWRLAAAHHTLYSSGQHGQDKHDAGAMRAALLSTFSGNLDLYLSGHDHDLEQFAGKTNPLFVVSGSASRKRPAEVKPVPKTFFSTYGFAVVDLTKSSGTVRLYDAAAGKWVLTAPLSH